MIAYLTAPHALQVVVEVGQPDPTWARDAARWLAEGRPWVQLVVVDDPAEIVLDAAGTPLLSYERNFLVDSPCRRPGWVLYYPDPDADGALGSRFVGGQADDLDRALTHAQARLSVLHGGRRGCGAESAHACCRSYVPALSNGFRDQVELYRQLRDDDSTGGRPGSRIDHERGVAFQHLPWPRWPAGGS